MIRDFLTQTDKQLHILISALVTTVAFLASMVIGLPNPIAIGAVIALSASVGKELWDRTKTGNKFSSADLIADVIGITIGAIACKTAAFFF